MTSLASGRRPMEKHENYAGGYDPALLRGLARREVRREASFLVPHLLPAMRVLDCGCGPGSITLGLAELVTFGEVVGIDIEAGQLEIGREEARRRCLTNVRFEQASECLCSAVRF